MTTTVLFTFYLTLIFVRGASNSARKYITSVVVEQRNVTIPPLRAMPNARDRTFDEIKPENNLSGDAIQNNLLRHVLDGRG